MNGLLGMLSLLSETVLSIEQKDMLNVAQVCGKTLLIVINDILDLCKLEASKISIDLSCRLTELS